MIKKLNDLIEF